MDLDKAIHERRSVRKFNSKKPNWRRIIECIDAARFAPMAGGNFSLKFILVDNHEKIKKIGEECQQNFISQAHYIVVVCSSPGRTVNSYGKKGDAYVKQQAGAAIENFLLKIHDVGLSTCWVEYFVESNVKNILDIPEEIDVEAIFPVGFEFEKKPTRKERIDLDRILYFNKYGQIHMR